MTPCGHDSFCLFDKTHKAFLLHRMKEKKKGGA